LNSWLSQAEAALAVLLAPVLLVAAVVLEVIEQM
jgi:hypothetical protein